MAIPNPQPNIIDNIKSDNTTWSSNKISSEISSGAGDMIDDASITDAKTWSSYKINQEIPKELDHLLDVTITEPASGDTLIYNGTSEKFENENLIDDSQTSLSKTWSSDKIMDQIAASYSSNERLVGKWIDGKNLYEVTVSGTTTDSSNAEVNKVIFDGTNVVDEYVYCEGTLKSGDPDYDNKVLGGYINSTNHIGFYQPSNSKEVKIYYNSSAYPSGSEYNVTIRYTKAS